MWGLHQLQNNKNQLHQLYRIGPQLQHQAYTSQIAELLYVPIEYLQNAGNFRKEIQASGIPSAIILNNESTELNHGDGLKWGCCAPAAWCLGTRGPAMAYLRLRWRTDSNLDGRNAGEVEGCRPVRRLRAPPWPLGASPTRASMGRIRGSIQEIPRFKTGIVQGANHKMDRAERALNCKSTSSLFNLISRRLSDDPRC